MDPAHVHDDNARTHNGMRDARTHVNRQKGRHNIEPPRTVAEQDAELLAIDESGRRRRDPIAAAAAQHTERDHGVGGAWIDVTSRAHAAEARYGERIFFEKLPRRHEQR